MSLSDETVAITAQRIRIHVSIDGPAGSGKTTIGKRLAAAILCPYLDTGLMYRAVTWLALQNSVELDDERSLTALAESMRFALVGAGESLRIDGEPPSAELRSREVDAVVSQVSAHAAVRATLVVRQREMARGRCIVMVGRDIGTVVLPRAEVKLWVVASPGERARRRLAEHLPGMSGLTLADAEREIMERDALDAGRIVSPLIKPGDAVELDTDSLTPDQCVERALGLVRHAAETGGRSRG